MEFKMISKEEQIKCQKVSEAFEELYELYGDMMVVDAGKFGFVHLRWFDGQCFSSNDTYTDSVELFEDLWEYWKEYHLLEPVKKTLLSDLSYEELYELLSPDEKITMEKKRQEFWHRAFES